MTKSERKQRHELFVRVQDIVNGAGGGFHHPDDDLLCVDVLSRAIPALQATFDPNKDNFACLWFQCNLNLYASINEIVEFYWRMGVRA